MNGTAIKILIVLIITLGVLAFLRIDYDFDVRTIIPFMTGDETGLYDWAGLILIALVIWGVTRLKHDEDS